MTNSGAASVPGLDVDTALGWIRLLHRDTGGYVGINSAGLPDDTRTDWPGRFYDLTDPGADDGIAEYLDQRDTLGVTGIYLGQVSVVARPPAGGRTKVANAYKLASLWADGDTASPAHKHVTCPGGTDCEHPDDPHRAVRYPLPADADTMWAIVAEAGYDPPSATQDTGNGVYAHWLLDEPQQCTGGKAGPQGQLSDRLHQQLKRAAARLKLHYGPLGDLARVLRLPGTLNRKLGTPGGVAMSRLTSVTDRRYTWGEMIGMVERAEERTRRAEPRKPAPAVVQPLSRGQGAAGSPGSADPDRPRLVQANSPIDDFNARADWLTDIMEPAGWQFAMRVGAELRITRPGKDVTAGWSATINGTGADTMHVFSSDAAPFEPDENYTKAGAWRELHHGGADGDPSWSATNRDLRARGYGDALPPWERPSGGPVPPDGDLWATLDLGAAEAAPGAPDSVPAVLPTLPVEFWAQRPYLAQIREAAHSRGAAADVVLHATLARLSGMIPHWAKADTGLGGLAPLNYFAAIVSDSGVGKSSDFDVARTLLQRPYGIDFVDEAPLGSGEGIAELFMGEVEVTTESDGAVVPRGGGGAVTPASEQQGAGKGGKGGRPPKPDMVRAQVRHNAFVTADEGTAMTELMHGRKGSTLGSTLRTAWSGGTLGNANASKDRYRVIPSGSYSIGMCVGFQRITVGPLLSDFVAGTPQRFAWVAAVDGTIPKERPRGVRRAAHALVWDPTIFGPSEGRGCGITVAESIKDRLWAQHVAKKAGELVVDVYDSHRPLFLVKVAGLLAVLDKRTDITEDDWSIAEQVWDGSVAVRTALLAHLERTGRDEARAGDEAFARRQVRAAEALEQAQDQAVLRVAKRITAHVLAEPGTTRGAVHRKLAGRDRPKFDEAVALAVTVAWLVDDDGTLTPGPSKPGDEA